MFRKFDEVVRKTEELSGLVSELCGLVSAFRPQNPREKKSPAGTKSPEAGKKNPGPWDDAWAVGKESRAEEIRRLRIRPVDTYPSFHSRYVLRPLGPTKLLTNIIRYVLRDPRNQNFHLKSKRAYVYTRVEKELRWQHITTKRFFDEFRFKILECYRDLVLDAHPHMDVYASAALAKCTVPLTNQTLERILGGLGTFPSWRNREKTHSK